MATRPEDRFKTAGELADTLGGSLQSGTWLKVAAPRVPWRAAATVALIVLLAVAGFMAWHHNKLTPAKAAAPTTFNLAVLPFSNTGTPEDEHFASGMTDEIRGRLARVPNLQVIASASTGRYRDSTRLEDVARQLGAGYLLTGKVRRDSGATGKSRVQISAELIQVTHGSAPVIRWQQVFDTAAADVSQVQGAIAQEVAGALGLASNNEDLGGLEQHRDPDAYEAYLRGQQILRQGASGPGDLQRALTEFQEAVKKDSMFAAAWAQLGWTKAALWNNTTAEANLLEEARADGERALRLGGAAAEGHQVLAYYHIMKGNRGAAREETRKGLEADPSNARLIGYTASFLELEGRWEEALRHRQRAATLDPTAAGHAAGLATNLLWLRRYPEARTAADRYIILGPTNPEAYQLRSMVALGEGKLDEARKFIRAGAAQIPPDELLSFVATYWDLYWLLDEEQQARVLQMKPEQFYGDTVWLYTASAAIHLLRGDSAAARPLAESARRMVLSAVEETPEDAYTHSRLALVNAFLGRKDDALRAAEKSISLLPIAKDALNGALQVYRLACVQARLGMQTEALATLNTLLSVPFYASPAWLRIDPNFTALKGNSDFERLTRSIGRST